MSDAPKLYTERQVVERERAAWTSGRYLAADYPRTPFTLSYSVCQREAAKRYPLPIVTRPRIVKDEEGDEFRWRVVTGLEFRFRGGEWMTGGYYVTTDNQRRVVADLLANPTETVEAGE